jgi:outer membrane protein assembly factor BamB
LAFFSSRSSSTQVNLSEGKNWAHPFYDGNNTSFNPQDAINRNNVQDLEIKWVRELRPPNPPTTREDPMDLPAARIGLARPIQSIPLVMDGTVFLADNSNAVFAVDAGSGEVKWSFQPSMPKLGALPMIHTLNSNGGLLFVLCAQSALYALNPGTGKVETEWAQFFPETKPDAFRNKDWGAPSFSAPSFFGSSAIVGSSTEDPDEARGFVASYDLRSKKMLWVWYVTPPAVAGPKNWDADAAKGNIAAYPNDWGEIDIAGRAAVWGQTVADEEGGRVYLGTGNPWLFHIEGSMRPGPLLYSDCLVCLDAKTGKMIWYHQSTPHDHLGWDFGMSVILAKLTIGRQRREVLIGSSKNSHVYVADAMTGKLVFQPIRVGYIGTPLNANKGNEADMVGSLEPGTYCPAHNGGINAAAAFAYNTIFVATQRFEQRLEYVDGVHKGKAIRRAKLVDIESPRYSTISAIDGSRGEIVWSYFIPNGYQGAGLTVSGNVVFGVDRTAILYMLDASNGKLLRKEHLSGHGSAGASIAATREGEMRLFVPISGAGGTENKLVCFGPRA